MGIKRGFTLAEVLITLVIIGVIAAITIPSLINKTNEQETVVAVKKAYSVLSQAYQRIVAENGEINPVVLGNSEDMPKTLGSMFAKQLNVQKVCGTTMDGDCFSTANDGVYKSFDSSDSEVINSRVDYEMRLSDGMSVAIWGTNSYTNYGSSEPLQFVFGQITVDINGDKAPNTFGKDVFDFFITKYGIIPFGTPEVTAFPLSSCYTTGHGCTAWVITKGNVDYWHKDVSW